MLKYLFLPLLLTVSNVFGVASQTKNASDSSQQLQRSETLQISESVNELDANQLLVSAAENTATELSQYFTFSFSTNKSVYFSSRYTTCKVIVTDPTFDNVIVDHSADKNYPEYTAAIYSISGSANPNTAKKVVIPSSVICFNAFRLKITSISSNCVSETSKYISEVIIPDSVETIPSDAFVGISEEAEFYFTSASEKAGWQEGWNLGKDLTGHNNYQYIDSQEQKEANDPGYSMSQTSNNGYQFVLGSYDENKENYYQPLVLKYDLVGDNGKRETFRQNFELTSKNSTMDRIGQDIGGEEIVRLSITIDKRKDQTIDAESLVIENIYKFSGNINDPIDFEYGACFAKVATVTELRKLEEYVTIKAQSFSTYSGYTQLNVRVDTVPGIYEKLNPEVYNQFKSKIDSGECVIRYRFTNIFESSYRIGYITEDGSYKSVITKLDSPFSFYNLDKTSNNRIGFLFKNSDVAEDFNPSSICSIELVNFYISLDVFSTTNQNVVSAQAETYTKFGTTTLFNRFDKTTTSLTSTPIKTNNLNASLVVICIVAAVVYIAIAIFLFFYYKKVFRNDEFRRLKPKQFIKKGIIYFIGYALIVLSITFIIFRWGFLNNSVIVYNPLDALVIIFTVSGAIALGLFIKDLVVAIRTSKKRRQNKKLHIDSTDADDGTK